MYVCIVLIYIYLLFAVYILICIYMRCIYTSKLRMIECVYLYIHTCLNTRSVYVISISYAYIYTKYVVHVSCTYSS